MTLPKFIYKYESINEYSLRNLKNATIYFNHPSAFNDPFDCSLNESSFVYDDNDLDILKHFLESQVKLGKIPPFKNSKDFHNHIKERLPDIFKTAVEEIIINQRNKRGCVCFSENNDSILMWGHYANCHSGICLKFDTSVEPFNRLFQVTYSNLFPKINPIKIITQSESWPINEDALKPLLTKYKCWEYESEWRLFHTEPQKTYGYPVTALKAVYFGVNVNPADLEIVCLILQGQNKNVKFFHAQKNKSKFEIIFDEFKYIPHTTPVK